MDGYSTWNPRPVADMNTKKLRHCQTVRLAYRMISPFYHIESAECAVLGRKTIYRWFNGD